MKNSGWNPRKLVATIALWSLFAATFFLGWSNNWKQTGFVVMMQAIFYILALAFSLMKE